MVVNVMGVCDEDCSGRVKMRKETKVERGELDM